MEMNNLPITNKEKWIGNGNWFGHETIFYIIHKHNDVEYFTINEKTNVHKLYKNPVIIEGIEIIFENE